MTLTAPRPVGTRRPTRSVLARAFGVTALLSAGGSLLGLLRDLLLARYFGADQGTDAFLVAWTVPETAAPLLIEDAMAFLMVPAFSLALSAEGDSGSDPEDGAGPSLRKADEPPAEHSVATRDRSAAAGGAGRHGRHRKPGGPAMDGGVSGTTGAVPTPRTVEPLVGPVSAPETAVAGLVAATLPPLSLLLAAVSAATLLGAPLLVRLLAPGLPDTALAVVCTRLTALTVLPFGLTGYLSAGLRAHRRFTGPGAVYIAYNTGILAVMVLLHGSLGVRAAAAGVAFGSVLMTALLLPAFARHCSRLTRRGRATGAFGGSVVRPGQAVVLSPLALLPIALFTLTRQSQVFVERFLASSLAPGTISHLNYAEKVAQMAMTLGVMVCTVTFPVVARALADGDLEAARVRVEKDLGLIGALVLSGTAVLMACAPQIVALLFQRGAFTPQDTAATASVIRVYSVGLLGQAMVGALVRPFFSTRPVVAFGAAPARSRDRSDWFPLAAMGLGLLVTVVLGLTTVHRYGALGLAAANATGITLTAALLLVGIRTRGVALRLRAVLLEQARLLAAAVAATAAAYGAASVAPQPLLAVLLGVLAGPLAFVLAAAALGAPVMAAPLAVLAARWRPRAGPAAGAGAESADRTEQRGTATGGRTDRAGVGTTHATTKGKDAMVAGPLRRKHGIVVEPDPGPSPTAPIPAASAPWTLMYHSVDAYSEDPHLVTVTPARFDRQMAWLYRSGLRGVGVDELLRAQEQGRAAGLVGLTFDDGYADLVCQVLPVLDRYGFTATAFVVAGRLGEHNDWDAGPRKRLLSADQLRGLAGSRVEIGSHGMYHQVLAGMAPEPLAEEVRRSREILEELLDRPVTGFCYPYGSVDADAAAAVRDSGYQYATAIAHSPLSGRWALPRSYVGERDTGWRLRAKGVRHRLRGLRVGTDGLPDGVPVGAGSAPRGGESQGRGVR